MQICASPYKSSQILPQRPTIYGDGESLRSTPVVHFVGKPCTLRHVLNACSVALFQGRYTWRHNSVLSVLQRHLLKFWDYARQQPEHQQAPFIRFVPERARAPRLPIIRRSRRPLPYQDALRCAQDWEFLFDLGEGLVFPPGDRSHEPTARYRNLLAFSPAGYFD